MRNKLLYLSFIVVLSGCNDSVSSQTASAKSDTQNAELAAASSQKIELSVDGTVRTKDPSALVSSAFMGSRLILSYMSEKDDVQFSVSAYLSELTIGTYQVYNCKSAAECNEQMPDNNQNVSFGPYPKNPLPPASAFRIAYYAPQLGLKPLTLVITSIKDEEQPGNPYKTKRIEGQLMGDLAYVEQEQGGYAWHVIGNTTKVEGSFSVLCSLR